VFLSDLSQALVCDCFAPDLERVTCGLDYSTVIDTFRALRFR